MTTTVMQAPLPIYYVNNFSELHLEMLFPFGAYDYLLMVPFGFTPYLDLVTLVPSQLSLI